MAATLTRERSVLAHIAALLDAVEHGEVLERNIAAIERLTPDAEAVAHEHGHVLGEWHATENLIVAARCQHCTATVCLKTDGKGSNAEPLRWLTVPCGAGERFYITKSLLSPMTHFVHDRERPQYEPIAMCRKKTEANAIVKRLNAEAAGEPVVDEVERLRTKRARLVAQLARVEAQLEAVAA